MTREAPSAGPPRAHPPLAVRWLGRIAYRAAWQLQEELRARLLDGRGGETLLLLEHDPVITLGRFADPAHVLLDEAAAAARGVEIVRTSRGGDVTYHGPGQLVAYPVVRLDRGLVAHVAAMAAAVVDVVARLGLRAEYRRDRPGVWVGDRKLCAFGVHVHRRVAIHGLALNVTTSAEPFSWIVPCGLRDTGVTSVAQELGAAPPPEELAGDLGRALAERLGRATSSDRRSDERATDVRCFPDLGP